MSDMEISLTVLHRRTNDFRVKRQVLLTVGLTRFHQLRAFWISALLAEKLRKQSVNVMTIGPERRTVNYENLERLQKTHKSSQSCQIFL